MSIIKLKQFQQSYFLDRPPVAVLIGLKVETTKYIGTGIVHRTFILEVYLFAMAQILFEDIFHVRTLNENGKKFERGDIYLFSAYYCNY